MRALNLDVVYESVCIFVCLSTYLIACLLVCLFCSREKEKHPFYILLHKMMASIIDSWTYWCIADNDNNTNKYKIIEEKNQK